MPGNDPRITLSADDLDRAKSIKHPSLEGAHRDQFGLYIGILVILLAGVALFLQLNEKRLAAQEQTEIDLLNGQLSDAEQRASEAAEQASQTQLDLELSRREIQSLQSRPPLEPATVREVTRPPVQPAIPDDAALRAPALVVDTGDANAPNPDNPAADGTAPGAPGAAAGFFAQQLNATTPPAAVASNKIDSSHMVPQGAVLSGVLETEINSDLPGFTRAIVTHDVRSFDNSRILIPRGARLIGQYRSGLNFGEARVFVIWHRLIRPDGISIDIASPATDVLGAAGLSGKVNNHYLKRFGTAILLSIIDIAARDALSTNNRSVILNQSNTLQGEIQDRYLSIPPTILVKPGKEIRIMLSRDLLFPKNLGK